MFVDRSDIIYIVDSVANQIKFNKIVQLRIFITFNELCNAQIAFNISSMVYNSIIKKYLLLSNVRIMNVRVSWKL